MKPVQPALSSASTLRAHALPARLREDAEAEAEMIKVQAEIEANKMKEQAMAEAQKLMDRAEAAVRAAQKVFAANPSNKFGVSTGLTLAAAGKAA